MSFSSESSKQKIVLMTGGSNGIGFQAAIKILSLNYKLILPCRNDFRAHETFTKLQKSDCLSKQQLKSVSCPVMDLSDIISINKFVREIRNEIKFIDVLILNAGLQYTGAKVPKWSKQKIELTFAVNHLSHYYLTNKLLSILVSSDNPRLIITSSEVHNPQSSGGKIGKPAGLGELQGLKLGKKFEMIDGSKFNADKAYKDSKLCNILFAKELSRHLISQNISMPVIAWAPGLVIPKTRNGFFQYSRKYNELGQRIFAFLARDVFQITTSTVSAGELLKDLLLVSNIKNGFSFYSNKILYPGKFLFEESNTSEESQDENLSAKLWELSDRLVSL